MNYLLFICSSEPTPAEEIAVMQREVEGWVTEMDGRGVRLLGAPLQGPGAAVTVRVRDGETLLSDGPFAETKEHIAGFDVIDCADLDEAIEVASKHPVAWFKSIEIRPFAPGLELGPQAPAFARDEWAEGQAHCLMMCVDGIPGPPAQEAQIMRDGLAWAADLRERGLQVLGHPLEHRETATTVRVRNGETLVTDGPFAETAEFIAGLDVISGASLQEAISAAAAHPLARVHRVEVRPFWKM